ncbi:hypothetical protein F5890DRAFT_1478521 [Lentinula detonsa]|uniref:Uncharacterized protein n=1 Tax=Lentinula detonsa TaxID=2804962 RepID=A0AA38PPS4_9AGAR|nr:hypothetical protein F5890DRAFT_1478521 [Lentinula detonsa]
MDGTAFDPFLEEVEEVEEMVKETKQEIGKGGIDIRHLQNLEDSRLEMITTLLEASRMSARLGGKKQVVPSELIPKTRVEQRAQRLQRETQKTHEKATAEQKKTSSKTRIAAQLDAQAQEDVVSFSTRPDLDSDVDSMRQYDVDASELSSSGGNGNDDQYGDHNKDGKGIDKGDNADESEADDSDPDSEMERLEEEIRLRKEKKKASKTSIRDEIAAVRVTKPKLLLKRAGSDTEKNPTSTKRSKLSNMGGLKDGWKSQVYQEKPHALSYKASRSSLASSDTGTTPDIEFEHHVVEEVKLEPADANFIAKEERETGKPARPPKRTHVKVSDVPFVSPSDQEVWNQHIRTSLIEWSSNQTNQFHINSDPKFRQTVQELWNSYLMPLPHISLVCTGPKGNQIKRSDHPALFSFAQADIRNYQSRVGKSALKIVEAHLELKGGTAVERKQLVEKLIHHDSFVYETPGLTVLRALDIFKTGYNTLQPDTKSESYSAAKKKPVNSPDNFSDKWAPDATRFFNLIQRLKGDKWELIFHASERYILDIPNAGAGPYLKEAQREAEKANSAQHEMIEDVKQFEELGGNDDILLSD